MDLGYTLPSLNACLRLENGSEPGLSSQERISHLYACQELINGYQREMRESDAAQFRRDLITYYLMGIGGMTVCSLGLVGNMLALIVLTHKSMRSSTYSYLSALCVCDSLMLLFTVILLVRDVDKPLPGHQRWPWDEGVYPYLFPYVHALAFTFHVTSIWLTLAFTVDRYIMICHPFKAEPLCTVKRARRVILVLFVTGAIFNIPKFFEYHTVAIKVPFTNTTKAGCDLTDFGKGNVFRELYHSWFYTCFVCGVPFLALAVLNGFLMHAVRVSRRKGREINAAERKRMDTTVMLIGVVVVFFICQMPALVSRGVWAFENDARTHKGLALYVFNELSTFLTILNSAINIVPYYFFGKKFRRHFWLVFCHCMLKYDRFRTFTHNTSMTMYDTNRRLSNGSVLTANNLSMTDSRHVKRPSGPHAVVSAHLLDRHTAAAAAAAAPAPVRHRPSETPSADSGLLYPEYDHRPARGSGDPILRSEVNGNCKNGDLAQRLLPVKDKPLF